MQEDCKETVQKGSLSRRSFLTGAASVGALAAFGGLAGCGTPSETDAASTASANAVASNGCVIPGAQDFDIYLPEAGNIAYEEGAITDIAETVECDVVICGAGIGGVTCAASCSENGLNTVLLEKGNMFAARGGDIACVADKVHQEAGVVLDPEQIVSELMLSSGYRASQGLIRKWVYRCDEAVDWALGVLNGAEGERIIKFADGDLNCGGVTWYATQIEFEQGMAPFVEGLLNYAVDNGVEVAYETPAVQLVQGSDGSITGVIAKNVDGSYVQYNAAKGVVLATGSYEFNPDMMKARMRPRDLMTRMWMNPTVTDTGDGHLMGIAAGAVEDEYPHIVMTDPSGNARGSYGPKVGMKPFLRVNAAGERYVNENIPWDCLANAISSQLGAHDFLVLDDNMVAAMNQMADVHDYPTPFEDDYEEMKSQCVSANTIEELADKLGLPADALKATIDRYNAFCESGVDEDFGKEAKYLTPVSTGPFYGFDEATMSLVTVSGLRVDTNSGVLSGATSQAIPGLYAIGNVSGSMFENFYPHHVNGVSHSRCVTFGYTVGRQLAGVE